VARLAAIMVTHGIHAVAAGSSYDAAPLVVIDLELARAALEHLDTPAAGIAAAVWPAWRPMRFSSGR
jgi:hypothetical protein